MTAGQAALVGLAGGVGAVLRAAIAGFVGTRRGFPAGILLVNLSGALLLGFLTGAAPGHAALRIAGTGLLGGYTTFSTWMLDSVRLERHAAAALNVGASLTLGVAGVLAGRALG